jgi:glycosyltransferase involved in cell wall biosynthesis
MNTLWLLARRSPDVLFVQNPSMVLAAIACVWGRIRGRFVVVDRHSTFMLNREYPRTPSNLVFRLLHRFTLRSANLTIVTNDHLAQVTRSFGGEPYVLPDRLPDIRSVAPGAPLGDGFHVVMPSSFAQDEPIEETLEAMRLLAGEDIRLSVTGNPSKRPGLGELPANVEFTGFLSLEAYEGLLRSADAIMVLTTSEHTMLCGCYEAVAVGKPLVTSSTGVLREYFKAAVFVESDAASIAAGLRTVMASAADLSARVGEMKREIESGWELRSLDLRRLIAERIGG